MKPQTFEEWMDETQSPNWRTEMVIYLQTGMRSAFRAGHENAARVAESLNNGFHSPYEYSANVEEAIREQGRK